MNHFPVNLALLKVRFPQLADRLEQTPPDNQVKLHPLPSGRPDVSYDGKLFYKGYPEEVTKVVMNNIKFTYPKLLVFYGVGLGYHLESFFKIPNKVSESIIIVEKSLDLFRQALHCSDLSKMLCDVRVRLYVGYSEEDYKDSIMDFMQETGSVIMVKALETVILPLEYTDLQKYYITAAKSLQEVSQIISGGLTCPPEDAYHGFTNIINNLPFTYDVPLFDHLEGKLKGTTGVVVSTGPSLKHSIPWLKEIQNKAVIACADSALRILLSHGIKPHFTACLERPPETSKFFEGLPPTPETWFITNPVIWPKTYGGYQGPRINLLRPIGQLKWFFPEGKLKFTGRSVSHLLYCSLRDLGCSSILLVGQDLAYERDSGKSHTEGAHPFFVDVGDRDREKMVNEQGQEKPIYIEGNDGRPILTTRWYKEFRDTFETFFRLDKTEVYNVIPPQYGAKLRFAKQIDPSQASSFFKGEEVPVRTIVSETFKKLKKQSREDYYKQQRNRLEEALHKLEKYHQITLDLMDAASDFYFRNNPSHYGEDQDRYKPFLQKFEKIMNSLFCENDEFYLYFLHALTMDRVLMASQAMQGIIAEGKKISGEERLMRQFQQMMYWLEGSLLWTSRLEWYIKRALPTLFTQIEKPRDIPLDIATLS